MGSGSSEGHRAAGSAVLYARVSVATEESVSVERQLLSGRNYAKARGWTIVGEFTDDGVSATSNKPETRNGWQALMAAPQHFDAVVIWKIAVWQDVSLIFYKPMKH